MQRHVFKCDILYFSSDLTIRLFDKKIIKEHYHDIKKFEMYNFIVNYIYKIESQ